MELELEKGATYFGPEFKENGVRVKSGARGIIKKINECTCVVSFPTILGWCDLELDKDNLKANGLSSDQTWSAMWGE